MKLTYITAQVPYGQGEAFIIDEMLAIKEAGINLLIIPRNPMKKVFHQEAQSLLPDTIWLPLLNFKIIFIFLISLIIKPYLLKILITVIRTSRNFRILLKNLAVIPKSVFIANFLQTKEITHIHAHRGSTTSTMAYVISKLSGIPWSFTLHRWDIKENNMLEEKIKYAKFVRCISENGKNELLEIISTDFKNKIKVIHMGVKIPINVDKVNNDEEKYFKIITPANLLAVKGHKYLIEACSILVEEGIKNFECIFYGKGLMKNGLKELIKEKLLNNYIKMPGIIPHEKLMEMYKSKKIDILILPSISIKNGEHEGIPVALMEAMAYTYHYLYGVDVTILRYFTVYGPAGRPDMSPFRFIKWIMEGSPLEVFGDGSQRRDFTYIDDIARGTIKALKPLGYEIINLGGNKPYRLNESIKLMEKYIRRKAKCNYKEFQKTDMKATWADIEKAKNLLDWKPRVNLEKGIKRTVEWTKDNWEWVKNIEIN